MKKLIDLNWSVGVLKYEKNLSPILYICSPSASDENSFQPAESVAIYGKDALIALRDALNEAYPPETS